MIRHFQFRWMSPGVLAACVLAVSGCATTSTLHYDPNPPAVQKPVLPLRVAVRAFANETREKYLERKMIIIPAVFYRFRDSYSVTRPYAEGAKPELTSERWGRWFSEDLARSGYFQNVDFAPGPDSPPPDLIIEGTLRRAQWDSTIAMLVFIPVYMSGSQSYAFDVRARRPSDGQVLWQGSSERQINGGGQDKWNAALRSMMFEIEQGLVKGLEARRADWPSVSAPAPAAASNAGDSIEDVLKRIGESK